VLGPVEPGSLLLVPALAASTANGWWRGGRLWLAVAWLALGGLIVVRTASGAGAFGELAVGWSVLVAAVLGMVTLVGGPRAFLPRALVSIAIALGASGALLLSSQTPLVRVISIVEREYRSRLVGSLASANRMLAAPEFQAQMAERPSGEQFMARAEGQLRSLPRPGAQLFPAFLALETLAALGLAWALYHRLSRVRLGPQLATMRGFRFNDQLVWGLIAGIMLLALSPIAEMRWVGVNLLVFFGALYLVRGMGVLVWFLNPGRAMTVLLSIAAVFLWPFVGATALAVGLIDTWTDWRHRARPTH